MAIDITHGGGGSADITHGGGGSAYQTEESAAWVGDAFRVEIDGRVFQGLDFWERYTRANGSFVRREAGRVVYSKPLDLSALANW